MKLIIYFLIILILLSPVSWAGSEKQGLDKIKPALLIVDIQKQYLPIMQKEGQESALKAMNELMKFFRKKKFPVVLVYHTNPNYGPKPGTSQFEFAESVEIDPADIKVIKNYGNAFKKTDLDKILKSRNVNTIFMCGLSGIGCIMATYHGALNLGYNIFLIKGTILSPKEKYTSWVEEICHTVGYSALGLILKGAE